MINTDKNTVEQVEEEKPKLKTTFGFDRIHLWFIVLLSIATGVLPMAADIFSYSQGQPKMRVSRSASLTLSTTWQKVDFSGTSIYNANTFGLDPVTNQPYAYWDATTKIFRFSNMNDVNYIMYFTGACSASLLSTPVSLRYRFVIPNGVSPGVPAYFPNPDNDQYSDLGPVTYVSHRPFDQTLPAYINSIIRTNGFYVEVALSNGTLGTITLDYAALLIQATAATN